MGFLGPWFLAGAALIGLPIYLHLIQRTKAKDLPFSSAMFFAEGLESTSRQRRVRYWLLMLLRVAVLLLLALVFAKPYFEQSIVDASARRLVVIGLDQTASMRAGTRWADARREALALLQSLPVNAKVRVISLNVNAAALTGADDSREQVRDAITALPVGDGAGSVNEMVRLAKALAEGERLPAEIHLFSDFQQSSVADSSPILADTKARLVPHPIGQPSPNFYVDTVQAPGVVYSGEPVKINATVAGAGTMTATIKVSLFRDSQLVQSKTVNLTPSGRATVEFDQLLPVYGPNRCQVRLDLGTQADGLSADNQMNVVIERGEAQRILLLHEGADTRSATYLGQAIAAGTKGAFGLDAVRAEALSTGTLKRYGLLILSDVSELAPSLDAELQDYVKQGGNAWVITGASTLRRKTVPLTDLAVNGSAYASREGQRFYSPSGLDLSNAILRGLDQLSGVRVYQAVKVAPNTATVMAKLNDGSPFLLEQKSGQGTVLILTSALDNIANDLPLSASFVPFVAQAVTYLTGASAQSTVQPVGTSIELRTVTDRPGTVEIVAPDGSRPLSLKGAATAASFVPQTEGVYSLKRTNGRLQYFAFNIDRRESDLAALSPEDLALWRGDAGNSKAGEGSGSSERARTPLWPWLLGILALAAIMESWLSVRYLSVQRG